MIEALKSDEIVNKVGGRFKLTALIQKRMLELMDGARPLVDRENMTDLEVVIQEILQDKITIDYEGSGLVAPKYVDPEPTRHEGHQAVLLNPISGRRITPREVEWRTTAWCSLCLGGYYDSAWRLTPSTRPSPHPFRRG